MGALSGKADGSFDHARMPGIDGRKLVRLFDLASHRYQRIGFHTGWLCLPSGMRAWMEPSKPLCEDVHLNLVIRFWELWG